MNAPAKTFGSPSGEPSTTRSMLQQMCEKLWTLPPKTFGTELKAATARAFQQYVDLTEARIQGEIADPNRFLQIDTLPRHLDSRGGFSVTEG